MHIYPHDVKQIKLFVAKNYKLSNRRMFYPARIIYLMVYIHIFNCNIIIYLCPDWLLNFLNVLGGAYAACALFNIGLFMVGKLRKVTGTLLLVATLLIVAKTYVCVLGFLMSLFSMYYCYMQCTCTCTIVNTCCI